MKVGLLFNGQGSQQAGMGTDLYENLPGYKAYIDKASAILGYDLNELDQDEEKFDKHSTHNQPLWQWMQP